MAGPPDLAEPPPRPSLCIVTSELIGPFKNGGIGTSITGLAQTLAAASFPVTVLYTAGQWIADKERERWTGLYAALGIALEWLRHEDAGALAGPVAECGFTIPWLVWRHLAGRRYDIIHFNDCMGEGFYCIAMKRLGAAFPATRMWVALHSPSQWIFELNRILPDCLVHSAFNYAERLSTRCADFLWSPSRYLLDWAGDHGFSLPATTLVQQYVLPHPGLFGGPPPAAEPPQRSRVWPSEIVFFGRLEERKGIRLFCAALARLAPLFAERAVSVTFLGKVGTVGDGDAARFLARESSGWRFPWTVVEGLGQQEAVEYLRSRPTLAVIASPADNSPCTVYEALAFALPFLAARTGGIPELITPDDASDVLFEHDPDALARRIEAALREGIVPARAAMAQNVLARRWAETFALGAQPPAATKAPKPCRLLGVVDHREGALAETLASLAAANVRDVVVVNRSGRRLDAGPCAVVESAEALRRTLLEGGHDALLLVGSGGAVSVHALPALVQALDTDGVDGLIPATASRDRRLVPPLGGSRSFCFYEGAAHTGGLVLKAPAVRRLAETRPLVPSGAFFGVAELAVAAGLELWPYCEPVFTFARLPPADADGRRAPERVAAYDAATPTERYYIRAVAHRAFSTPAATGGRLHGLRERLYQARLGWAARLLERAIPRRMLQAFRRGRRKRG